MSKEELRVEPGRLSPVIIRQGWKLGLFSALTLLAGIFAWGYASRLTSASRATDFLFLAWMHGGLVFLIESCLAVPPLAHRWRYRLAFLLASLPFLLHSAWLLLSGAWLTGVVEAAAILGGAFAGALAATARASGLWENNSPPAAHIQSDVLQGHARLAGHHPGLFSPKRAFDILLALSGLVLSAPVWILSTFLIWFEDPGPVLFVKNSVGRGGVNFHQFKLRTMVSGAEDGTGPVAASEGDRRVLRIGRLLRKTALDELPQLFNILRGEMSFVGPRPQRTVLVRGYLEHLPEYALRHQVAPGLAGLAQVAGDYYLTPRQKLRFDRLYIAHASLGFDLKLIFLAFLVAFWYRWRPGWNGRLPRWLFRLGPSVRLAARRPTGSRTQSAR